MKKRLIEIGVILFVIAALLGIFTQSANPFFNLLITMIIVLFAAGVVFIVFGSILKG